MPGLTAKKAGKGSHGPHRKCSFEIFLFNAWVEVLGKRFGLADGPLSWLLWSVGSVLAGLGYHFVVERCMQRAGKGDMRAA